jgi:hypothetical protein
MLRTGQSALHGGWTGALRIVAALCVCASAAQAGDITWTNAAGGDFQTPGNWNSNIVPGVTDVAIFNLTTQPYTVTWSGPSTSGAFKVNRGDVTWNLQGNTFYYSNVVASTVGTTTNRADLSVTNGTVYLLKLDSGKKFSTAGTGTTVRILNGANFTKTSYGTVNAKTSLIIDGPTAKYDIGLSSAAIVGDIIVTNGGVFDMSQGAFLNAGGSLQVHGNGSKATVATFTMAGTMLIRNGAGVRETKASVVSTSPSVLTIDNAQYYHNTTNATDGLFTNRVGSTVEGSGQILLNAFANAGGTVRPGGANQAGTLQITGGFSNAIPGSGTIAIELGGTATNEYDRLQIPARGTRPRTLWAGGTLDVTLINGFTPADGDSFDILDFTNAVGTFDTLNLPAPAWYWNTNSLYTDGIITYAVPVSLDPPAGVSATDGYYTDKVRVTWDAVAAATGYEIWSNLSADTNTASLTGTAAGTNYDDTTTTAAVTNHYWVKATNATFTSGFSIPDSGWKAASLPVPAIPANLQASDGVYMYQGRIEVSWNVAADATGYEIWRSLDPDSGTAALVGSTAALTYNDTTTVASVTNHYWVKAFNPAHTSGFSAGDTGWKAPVPPVSIVWTNPAGGDFQTAANWSPQFIPGCMAGITNVAVFNLTTQPYTVTWSGPITNEAFRVNAGDVTWNLQGYTYSLADSISDSAVGTASTTAYLSMTNGTVYMINFFGRNGSILGTGTTMRVLAGASIQRYPYPNLGAGARLIMDGGSVSFSGYMTGGAGDIMITNDGVFGATDGTTISAGGSLRASGAGLRANVYLNNYGALHLGQDAQIRDYQTTPAWSGSITLEDNSRYYYLTTFNPPTTGRGFLSGAAAVLQGSGQLDFNGLVNSNGTIRPGGVNSAGLLYVSGDVSNAVPGGGTIDIELGGVATNQYDRLFLAVRGTLPRTLWAGGTLNVTLINGFTPPEATFKILDFASAVGQFSATNLPGTVDGKWNTDNLYTTGELIYTPPPPGTLILFR